MAMSAKMATNVTPELLLAVWKEKNVMEKRKRRRKEKKREQAVDTAALFKRKSLYIRHQSL